MPLAAEKRHPQNAGPQSDDKTNDANRQNGRHLGLSGLHGSPPFVFFPKIATGCTGCRIRPSA